MNSVTCKFSMKRVQKTTDNDYIKSLSIYNDTTPYEIRTPTNEITYWLNNQNKNTPFEIFAFSLFINDINIGFLMLSYLKQTKVMMYEYLAVLENFRLHTVFMAFENLFRNYFRENNIEISYYLTEISFKNNGKSIDRESKAFEKMLCIEDYGKIKMLYYNPPIGLDNHESEFQSYLYARDINNSNSIEFKTFLDIVHSIYFDYTLNWYAAIMSQQDLDIYSKQVQNLYKRISDNINTPKTILIERNTCSFFDSDAGVLHNELPISNKTPKILKWIGLILFILIVPILIVWIYGKVLNSLGESINNMGIMAVTLLTSIISALAAVFSAKKPS